MSWYRYTSLIEEAKKLCNVSESNAIEVVVKLLYPQEYREWMSYIKYMTSYGEPHASYAEYKFWEWVLQLLRERPRICELAKKVEAAAEEKCGILMSYSCMEEVARQILAGRK